VDHGVQLQSTEFKGEGVFATRSFQMGETVMIGEIERELETNDMHASQVSLHRWVLHAGLMRKINHSCDPTCGVRVKSTGAIDLVARRDIGPGEEITYDYAMRNYTVEFFSGACRCGSPYCRGRITGWKGLSAQRKADYRGLSAPYLTELDVQAESGACDD
jgi:hypothetical protein